MAFRCDIRPNKQQHGDHAMVCGTGICHRDLAFGENSFADAEQTLGERQPPINTGLRFIVLPRLIH